MARSWFLGLVHLFVARHLYQPIVCTGVSTAPTPEDLSSSTNIFEAPQISFNATDLGNARGFTRSILANISFELYTRRNPDRFAATPEQFVADFRPQDQTKIIIHGYNTDTRSEFVQSVKDTYLADRECNVIAVAWPSRSLNYPAVADSTKEVGLATARLVDYLHDQLGAAMELIHLIGHSLGAQSAGIAGELTRNRIVRISGLDAALPGFSVYTTPAEYRIDASDADYVDMIHTCAGALGIFEPVGAADFYPNGGKPPQPGCDFTATLGACSHGRSYLYWRESIRSPVGFWGHACASWPDFERGLCPEPTSPMGDPASPQNGSLGVQFLRTNDRAPFALGYV